MIKKNALNAHDAIASGSALADLTDAPKPTFLDDEGPILDVPMFITRTNAHELFRLRLGETVARKQQARPRKTR